MLDLSLGLIETVGLAAAVEAADVCVKSANVELIGYELSKGGGMITVKIQGNVGSVKAAVDAAVISASKVNKVVSSKVIPRPSNEIEMLINNKETVGCDDVNEDKNPIENTNFVDIKSDQLAMKQIEDDFNEENIKYNICEIEEKFNEEQIVSQNELNKEQEILQDKLLNEEIEKENQVISNESENYLKNSDELNEESYKKEYEKKYTCNICKDPKCTRKKGDLKSECIHYKEYK